MVAGAIGTAPQSTIAVASGANATPAEARALGAAFNPTVAASSSRTVTALTAGATGRAPAILYAGVLHAAWPRRAGTPTVLSGARAGTPTVLSGVRAGTPTVLRDVHVAQIVAVAGMAGLHAGAPIPALV